MNMKSKVGIDFSKVEQARGAARAIAEDVQTFVDEYTTVAVERTLCRFVGIDGVDGNQVPLPNVVVEHLVEENALSNGALFYLASAMVATGKEPQEIAEEVSDGKIKLTQFPAASEQEVADILAPYIKACLLYTSILLLAVG